MIDLSPPQLAAVRAIVDRQLPGCEVRVFGSRVRGTAKPHSDLDLAIVGSAPLGINRLGRLREAFMESDLPMRVDLLDWHAIPESFRRQITGHYEVLHPGAGTAPD
jgi:predicted nucleotidyltransferase